VNTRLILSLVVIVVLLTSVGGATAHQGANAPAAPQAVVGTGFTFQGQLKNAGATVTGNCDMTFKLYDAAVTGAQIGSTITATVPVSNSLFTVMLNTNSEYGANAFNGYARWLEVSVKCGGDTAFTTLAPRQQITAAPYAQYSLAGANAGPTRFVPLMRPQSIDLATVDPDLVGFEGGFTDGRYGYLVPNKGETSGKIARIDLQSFITSSVTILNLAAVDSDLHGFYDSFTDGRYGYFVPFVNASFTPFGKIARVDLQNFTTSGVTVLNLQAIDPDLKGFSDGFTDGRYAYLVPGFGINPTGKIPRIDLQNFTAGGVTVLDLTGVDPSLKPMGGGFTDGRYAYIVPASSISPAKVARIDLQNFTITGVTLLDLSLVDPNLKGFSSITDGRYGYLVPSSGSPQPGKMVRFDLQNYTPGGVTVLDLTTVDLGLNGFNGAFIAGQYVHLVPHLHTGATPHGTLTRVDLRNFTVSGVTWIDLMATDPNLKGFYGGFTDGRYGYLVPGYPGGGGAHGNFVRFQLSDGVNVP
jgi:hypothetical protein